MLGLPTSPDLNQRPPEGYFAEPNVQFGIEIDVATFEEFAQERGIVQFPDSSYSMDAPARPNHPSNQLLKL